MFLILAVFLAATFTWANAAGVPYSNKGIKDETSVIRSVFNTSTDLFLKDNITLCLTN
jgi:hypothetical protein